MLAMPETCNEASSPHRSEADLGEDDELLSQQDHSMLIRERSAFSGRLALPQIGAIPSLACSFAQAHIAAIPHFARYRAISTID